MAAARQYGIGITLHLAESVLEFQDSIRHTVRTPVGMLYDLDFLGPEVVLGHGLYTTGHSQIAYTQGDDLALLSETGASVAHSPTVFARRGVYLESFQRYLDAGINLAIGTDSYPQDMLGELKTVALMGKIADRDFEAVNTRDVFNAATLGGARALGRDDLGRLAPGARADILIVDFQRARVGPFLDPINALVQCCDGEVIDTVIVAGQTRVENGQVLMWDQEELLAGVRRSCANAWARFADYWPDNEPIDAVFPSAFERWGGMRWQSTPTLSSSGWWRTWNPISWSARSPPSTEGRFDATSAHLPMICRAMGGPASYWSECATMAPAHLCRSTMTCWCDCRTFAAKAASCRFLR